MRVRSNTGRPTGCGHRKLWAEHRAPAHSINLHGDLLGTQSTRARNTSCHPIPVWHLPSTPPTHFLLFLHTWSTQHSTIPSSIEPRTATIPSMQYFWKELASTAFVSALPSTASGSAPLSTVSGSAPLFSALVDLLLTALLRLSLFTPGGPIVHVSVSCTPLPISPEGWHGQQMFFPTLLGSLNEGIRMREYERGQQCFHGFSRNQGNSQRPCKSLLSGPSLSSQLCLHFGVATIQFF